MRQAGRRATSLSFLASLALLLSADAAFAAAPEIGARLGADKVRPAAPFAGTPTAELSAARNEFGSFQVVISGGDAGAQVQTAAAPILSGPGGYAIGGDEIVLYREGLYRVYTPSNDDGATGMWPDSLIPAVDPIYHETRNAFPMQVPAHETRAIWVDVHVPEDAPPGDYRGELTVTVDGTARALPVSLHVWGFTLPSTASLRSAFGMEAEHVCGAHTPAACQTLGTDGMRALYARVALENRISIADVVRPEPSDWSRFDQVYGPLLDGTASSRLPGAKLSSLWLMWWSSGSLIESYAAHFHEKGWFPKLFHYTCDEPTATCSWWDITNRATTVHAVDPHFPTSVTTTIGEASSHGVLDSIDIIIPVVNFMQEKGAPSARPQYDAFLSKPGRELWWYQSCMSHGCGAGCSFSGGSEWTGWPNIAIDASGPQNQAQEWLSFVYGVSGELYWDTTYHLNSAWTDMCDFSGNGDGTLFYPGRPDLIGGQTDIPIESIRMKMIRDGMQSYEYLKKVADLGDPALAMDVAKSVFPNTYSTSAATPADVTAARATLARRIEELAPLPPVSSSSNPSASAADSRTASGCRGCSSATDSVGAAGLLCAAWLAGSWRRRRSGAYLRA